MAPADPFEPATLRFPFKSMEVGDVRDWARTLADPSCAG